MKYKCKANTTQLCNKLITRKPCYRKEDRAMCPIRVPLTSLHRESSSTGFFVRSLVSRKFFHVPLEVGGSWMAIWLRKGRCWANCSCS